jgi:class 3 adenylate cyclase/CHASE2 domain-containing sensor protein
MRRFQRIAFAVGALITAVVLLVDLLDGFRWPEDWSVDLRQRHARWVPERIGDQIRLVAIDDKSLDTLGRWPWPRARIATAFDEIRRAGAKAMALDVLFLEPEQGGDGDRLLAESVSRMPTVVAVSALESGDMDPAWRSAEGTEALRRFVDAASRGIDRSIDALVLEARLQEPYRSLVTERPGVFKALAAWIALEDARMQGRMPGSLEAFIRRSLGPSPGRLPPAFQRLARAVRGDRLDASHVGDFGERALLERAWSREQSWLAIQPRLKPATDAKGSAHDLPPIPELARAGSLFGVVNAEPDAFDGRLRRITPMFPTNHGLVPQLGVAAALAFRGEGVEALGAAPDRLTLGAVDEPLQDDHLRIAWPTDLLAGFGSSKAPGNALVSIGKLVEHAKQRASLEAQERRLRELGREIATESDTLGRMSEAQFDKAFADGSLRAALREKWEEWGDEVDAPDLDPRVQSMVSAVREWLAVDAALPVNRRAFAETDAAIRATLSGKLVFVGFTATGTMADMVATVFDPRTPGVFAHVVAADMLLNGRFLRFVPAWVSPLAVVALGLCAALVAARFGAGVGFGALIVLLAGYVGVLGVLGFDRFDVVYPMAAPVTAGFGSWVMATAAVAVINQREKQRITKQFRARVSPQLVDLLVGNPKAVSMEGIERETTILFGDLAGFTTISEKLGGPAVVRTLNLYMGELTRELTRENAYVNKFLGDGLLAFWSAFEEDPAQRERAVRASMECQRMVREIGQRPDRAGLPPISLRLGVATGRVVIGDCGAPPDLNDYTVIGDAANLAARLESANKQFGTSVLLDGRTAEGARAAGLPVCSLGKVVVVGQSVPVEVCEVCLDADPAERIRLTEAAVRLFAEGDFDGARTAFGALEKRFGASRTAATFVEAMDRPGEARDGVLRLRAK